MSDPIADGKTSKPNIVEKQTKKVTTNEVPVQTENGKPGTPDLDVNLTKMVTTNEVAVQTENGKPRTPDLGVNLTKKVTTNEVPVQTENGKPGTPDLDVNPTKKVTTNEVSVQTENGKPGTPDLDVNATKKEILYATAYTEVVRSTDEKNKKNDMSDTTSENKPGGTDGHNNDDTGVTSTKTPLDKPSSDQIRENAGLAGSGLGNRNPPPKSPNSKSKLLASQQKGSPSVTTGGDAGTSKGADNAHYAGLEEKLQKLTQRCAAMEETMQSNLKIFSFVCLILIAIVVKPFFFNEEGNASPVSDSRLKKVEDQLGVIQGNLNTISQLVQTVEKDVERIESDVILKHNVFKQQLSDIEITMEKQFTDMGSNIQNKTEDIKTQMGHIEGDVRSTKTQLGHIEGEVRSTKTQMGLIEGEVRSTKTQMGHIEGEVRSTKTQMGHIEGEVRSTKTQMGQIEGEVRRTTTQMGHIEGEVKNTKTQMGLIEGEVRSTREHAEQLVATTNEDIRKGGEQIIQIRENLESLDRELNITTGKLNRTKEIQDIIHINTFDKGSLIIVMLIIISGLAALGFYVCLYKPWQPRNFSQANASEAQQALNAVPLRPVLGSTVCIISFNSNRSAGYQNLVRSALSTSGCTDTMHEITKHSDISRLPHCKIYIMCVEFSERHVIIEEPGLALGDMKRTTYEAVEKLGGALVILYVNHRGSSRIQNLYSTEIYCVNRQPQLKTLETRHRFISTYDQLNDRQKDALKQALREALN